MNPFLQLAMMICVVSAVFAQDTTPVPTTPWRQALMDLPAQPPANTSAQDIAQFQQNVSQATPYFAELQPADYEANRELIRRMVIYLTGVEMVTRDPRIRAAASQAYLNVAALRWVGMPGLRGYGTAPTEAAAPAPVLPPLPATPPFVVNAPEPVSVAPASKGKLIELQASYELASTQAAAVWQSAITLRQALQSRGMTLNTLTETSLARVQLYLELAANALMTQSWDEAEQNIKRASYETANVRKVVGR